MFGACLVFGFENQKCLKKYLIFDIVNVSMFMQYSNLYD